MTIYTDGAFNPNRNVGGWAAIIIDDNGNETILSGCIKNTTSNRMELLAVMKALFTLSKPTEVEIITDATYVATSFNKSFKQWVEKSEYERPHFDLWNILYNLDQIHKLKFTWIKGHSGNSYNDRCDELAKAAIYDNDVPNENKKKKSKKKKKGYYAVARGRSVGVFRNWIQCEQQVIRYGGSKFKRFDDIESAEAFVKKYKI